MRIPAHIIDEIMTTARIEEVIGDYVNLKRAGSNLKGLSPFTEEKTPSFVVSPAKQIFKCFSTGKGGTVVSFLMEQEQFSYPEALKNLADRYNIELPEEKPLTPEELAQQTERESLSIINDFARDFFVERMHQGEEGKTIGLSYFVERGFRTDIIDKFQLGYCPEKEQSFSDTALKKGFKKEYLEKLGLTKSNGDRTFDFFSGRVIFPIHSVSGKVLGFGARTLRNDKKIAKYFNSPESIIYNKSKVLYGIYFAKSHIIKHDNCFLVEGYTDVISLFQSGVENVVSSSGTSLTKDQIKLIQRYTQNITILYDGDAAGIKASFRGIDLILEQGLNVKVVLFPDGDDPDSFAKKVSTEELTNYIESAQKDFVSFKTDLLLKDSGDDPIKRANLIKDIAASVALIPDQISRSVFIQSTARKLNIEEQTLVTEVNKIRHRTKVKEAGGNWKDVEEEQAAVSQKPKPTFTSKQRTFFEQEEDLVRIIVLYGSRAIELNYKDEKDQDTSIEVSVAEVIIHEILRDELFFENELFKGIFEICKKGVDDGILYDPQYFLRSENQEIVQFVSNYLTPKHELSQEWLMTYKIDTNQEIHRLPQALMEALYSFKNARIQKELLDIQEQLNPKNESYKEERIEELLKKQIELQQIKSTFASQLGRIII
jgi:DNA primase